MVRLSNHNSGLDKDVHFLITRTNFNMWLDIEKRIKKLATGSLGKKGMVTLGDQYTGNLIGVIFFVRIGVILSSIHSG